MSVADVVNPFSIGGGDAIHAYETEGGTFRVWERTGDGKWNAPVTVNTSGVSQSKAEEATFAPGKAFWFVRNAPGPYIYLVGRFTGEDYVFDLEGGSAKEPGHTLVANPTFFDVALNATASSSRTSRESRRSTPRMRQRRSGDASCRRRLDGASRTCGRKTAPIRSVPASGTTARGVKLLR